jgi:dihydroxy-acid dehydratase
MKKWRSRVTTDGLDRAPHRAFMRAMGLDDEAIAKPMIGVVSMKGEQTPCNMTHDFQVDAAKAESRRPAARRANSPPFRCPTASA